MRSAGVSLFLWGMRRLYSFNVSGHSTLHVHTLHKEPCAFLAGPPQTHRQLSNPGFQIPESGASVELGASVTYNAKLRSCPSPSRTKRLASLLASHMAIQRILLFPVTFEAAILPYLETPRQHQHSHPPILLKIAQRLSPRTALSLISVEPSCLGVILRPGVIK